MSPSFEREYNLKYLGRIGNVFHTKDIEAAIEKGHKYNPDPPEPCSSEYLNYMVSLNNNNTMKVMGIDPAWGSSAFGIVEVNDRRKRCVHCSNIATKDVTIIERYCDSRITNLKSEI